MRAVFFKLGVERLLPSVALLVGLCLCLAVPASGAAPEGGNRLLAVSLEAAAPQPTVLIKTQNPVGYRYTVYDSFDPVRVVLDFPGMDVTDIKTPIIAEASTLQEIRVSSFELTSGKLGRIELLLAQATPYDVVLDETDFRITFAQAPAVPVSASPVDSPVPSAGAVVPSVAVAEEPKAAPALSAAAERLESIEVLQGRAVLHADGSLGRYRHFALGAPPRLVVDIFGVQPEFKERTLPASHGMSGVRVGSYSDKTRVVFDAEGETLPTCAVTQGDRSLVVTWGADAPAPARVTPPVAGVPVAVEAVDFQVENGKSVLSVSLSGPADVIEATADGATVRFGLRNASIARSLRRTVDASAFPSAVRLITPYLVQAGDSQEVRFAAELKGPVPYVLRRQGNVLLFEVTDGPFAEPAPAPLAQLPVAAPAVAKPAPVVPAPAAETKGVAAVAQSGAEVAEAAPGSAYTGEKITLIFDDADIRRIFQLIGEVSNLNMLVGDQVKGTITLRLIDVPWDQALDLILDIKNLGMLQEGNVVRIMPRDELRTMRQAELTAVKEERELEPLVTEVIGVSYTALSNITGPAGELLTDRGKITPDNRNKQLIVTDIPSVIAEVKKLVQILDTPEKQVMIEARIVEASDKFARDLGVSWNLSYTEDDVTEVSDLASGAIAGGGSFNISPGSVIPNGIGSSFTFGKLGVSSTVLDLRLSAGETSSTAKVLSKPRVTTLNGETAKISQGTTIPYQSVSDEGTKTEFVDATLELNVTPVINPDNSIILEIKTSKNKPVVVAGADAPGIDKNEATTKVLVRDGETTVIGGIFTEDNSTSEAGIPLLRKIPFFGYLFKSTNKSENRSELLIFITPRILEF